MEDEDKMPYQVKSTPFFRRMVSTYISKKNGQLQRLKEEYERMMELTDRIIETKIRQVRLKRLFREIEEIKESSSHRKRRRIAADRSKTDEEIRAETLVKSKELGKQYSKMNALVDRCVPRIDAVPSGAAVGGTFLRMELERKDRFDKRISYGNNRSRLNIQKLTTNHRKPVGKQELATERELKELKEKLKNQLSFGNSCSSRNLVKRAKKTDLQKSSNGASICSLNDSETIKAFDQHSQYKLAHDVEAAEWPLMMFVPRQKNLEDMCQGNLESKNANTSDTLVKTQGDQQIRAKQRWRKLALIVRERFGTLGQRNMLPLVDNQEDSSEEYELREISNDTDLTLRQLKNKTSPPNSESDLLPGEVLLSVESLDSLEMQSLPDPNTTASGKLTADEGSSPKDPLRKVQQYVKMFEPIVRDAARKEVLEFGIEKLRSIFKHQSVEQ